VLANAIGAKEYWASVDTPLEVLLEDVIHFCKKWRL